LLFLVFYEYSKLKCPALSLTFIYDGTRLIQEVKI
jgi:hypothetical protein